MATSERNVRARGEILRLVRHYKLNGISFEGIYRVFRQAGKLRALDDIDENVEYLRAKDYLTNTLEKEAISGVERWIVRITPKGIDLLDETIERDPGVEIVC